MTETNEPHAADQPPQQAERLPLHQRIVEAEALFEGDQEVLIRNGNDLYRLRRTRLGKLILCK